MTTPDPIALPELPEPFDIVEQVDKYNFVHNVNVYDADQVLAYGQARYEAGRAAQAKHHQQQVGHLPKDAIAWLDMGKGEAQLMFGKRDASNRANRRQLAMLFEKVNPGYHPLYLHPQEEVAAPPLNELLGQREELPLNEPSGNPGQLASLEQRARELLAGECENSGFPEQAADLRIGLKLGGLPGVALRAITAALSAQPQSEVASELGAIRTLVAAANAVLALHPADDGMWTLEQAVRPFNAVRPSECENGCPDNQVCDYCQFAAPQPRVTPEHWIEIGKAQALAEFTEQRAAQRRELLAAPQSSEVRSDTNWHECPHCKGWSRATTTQDAAVWTPEMIADIHQRGEALHARINTPQPGVDLEQFRPAVEALERAGRVSEVKDGQLHWHLNEKHWEAQRLFAIIDAAAPGVQAND